MLATPVPDPALRPGWASEPKWDGFRALLSVDTGRVVLRSRRGTEMAASFPEIVAGAAQLPDANALDGELVVWEAGRLAFERLQNRLQRRRRGPGGGRVAGPLRRVRSAAAVRNQHDPDGRIGGAGPRSSPCSPPVGCPPHGRCARRRPTRTPCASG
ncbi:ATP-dependent DNA ligase [Streptomyces sp. NPDC001177]